MSRGTRALVTRSQRHESQPDPIAARHVPRIYAPSCSLRVLRLRQRILRSRAVRVPVYGRARVTYWCIPSHFAAAANRATGQRTGPFPSPRGPTSCGSSRSLWPLVYRHDTYEYTANSMIVYLRSCLFSIMYLWAYYASN